MLVAHIVANRIVTIHMLDGKVTTNLQHGLIVGWCSAIYYSGQRKRPTASTEVGRVRNPHHAFLSALNRCSSPVAKLVPT